LSVFLSNPIKIERNTLNFYSPAAITATLGFTGSLTKLTDGTSAFIAGANMTITTQSNGSILFTSAGSGSAGADFDWVDNGGNLLTTSSLNVENDAFFSGTVTASLGFTGSLTQLTNGNPYIQAIGSLTVTTQSDGSLLFSGSGGSSSGGGTLNDAYDFGGAGAGRTITVDAGAVQLQGTTGSNALEVTGSTEILGAFSATSKSFLIEHPVTKGWKLRHGSLEGPEHGVYFRGITSDNIIVFPSYWKELVDLETISIQLTSKWSNVGGELYLPRFGVLSIEEDKILIREEKNRVGECYFVVNAERKDIEKMEVEIR
jgi:hypothetical protein